MKFLPWWSLGQCRKKYMEIPERHRVKPTGYDGDSAKVYFKDFLFEYVTFEWWGRTSPSDSPGRASQGIGTRWGKDGKERLRERLDYKNIWKSLRQMRGVLSDLWLKGIKLIALQNMDWMQLKVEAGPGLDFQTWGFFFLYHLMHLPYPNRLTTCFKLLLFIGEKRLPRWC